MLELVQSAYDILDQLHLSVSMLIVIGAILLVTLVISTRELATWFLKINSLKRELQQLNQNVVEMKSQLAKLQHLSPTVVAPIAAATAETKMTEPEPRHQFPISH